MPKHTDISPVIDGLLRLIMIGSLTATAILAPNAVQLMDKPMRKYFDKLDEKAQQRELNRMMGYMKKKNLIADDYEHGLQVTDKARKRLERQDLSNLSIHTPISWDGKWHISFYDIPERHKGGRDVLTYKLRQLGCHQLQKSVWVHPYPYEATLTTIAAYHKIDRYITYIETSYPSNQTALIAKFPFLSENVRST